MGAALLKPNLGLCHSLPLMNQLPRLLFPQQTEYEAFRRQLEDAK